MAQNFCYVEDGEIKKVQPLPKNWKNVSGFNKITDLAKLKTFGWLPFEEVFEEYDQTTHYRGKMLEDIQADKVVFTDDIIAFTADQMKMNNWSNWLGAMSGSDNTIAGFSGGLSHSEETAIDMIVTKFPTILNEAGNEAIKAKHEAKKALRATKPPVWTPKS